MSKAITDGQARGLIASFAVDTPWGDIQADVQPFVELTPKERGEAFAAFIRNGFKSTTIINGVREFNVFRTIKLGTHKDADALKKALKKAGFNISDWANDIMGKPAFTVAPKETEVKLVTQTVADLGFKGSARYDEICARAKELGLELCPPEVGPQLRLQYKEQPSGEWLVIAMEAIVDSDGYPNLLHVGHGSDGLWLSTCYGGPDGIWDADNRFVFVSRK